MRPSCEQMNWAQSKQSTTEKRGGGSQISETSMPSLSVFNLITIRCMVLLKLLSTLALVILGRRVK